MAGKNDIDLAFEQFEHDCGEGKVIRREMIENLRKVANNPEMAITPYDKAMVIQSKLMIIKTLDDVLKSDEDVSLKKLKMRLARKDSETNGMVGAQVVEMLKHIRAIGEETSGNATVQNPEDAKKAILDRVEDIKKAGGKDAKAVTVGEGELLETDSVQSPERPEDEKEEE